MNTKTFDSMLKQAEKQWATDNDALEPLHAAHLEAQAQLQTVETEQARLRALVDEFENDMESEIGPDEFEAALVKLRTSETLLRRAEMQAKKASQQWQDAQRLRHRNAQRALGTFQSGFDKEAAGLRAEYSKKFQALL